MKRVGLFCDWGLTGAQLIDALEHQTLKMKAGKYKNLQFVDADSEQYDYAVVFNYPTRPIHCEGKNVVGLILEPPEILQIAYQNRHLQGIGRMYSFCDGTGFESYPGLGFFSSTILQDKIDLEKKSKLACMFVSHKEFTPYHLKRKDIFAVLLATDLGIDFYGWNMPEGGNCKGSMPYGSKGEVVQEYKFCIDFENSPHNVVTDKFFDSIVSNTFPITNATILNNLIPADPKPYFYIDFSQPTDMIVKQVTKILKTKDAELLKRANTLQKTKLEIIDGELSLVEWIYRRMSECE